jgi:three-Cys-motif partner protein
MARKHYSWKLGEPVPEIGAHSLAKHSVSQHYTERYIHILSSVPAKRELNLTVVDGFCGGGAYRYGSNLVAGSPLILLRAVKGAEVSLAAVRQHSFNVRADFFFVDRVAEHIDFLRSELDRSEFKAEVGRTIHLAHDTFENQAPSIIAAIRAKGPSHRALFFLDQYGWSAVSFASIRQIFAELNNPEVLITFSVDCLIDYLTSQTAATKSGQAIELDPSLGEALSALKSEQGQRYVIQGFLYRHILKNTGALFYTPFFIRSPESHRSYWLLHLSKHARARDEMARLHWEMTNTFIHPGSAGFNALGYDPDVDPNQLSLEFDFGTDARKDSINGAIEQLPKLISDEASGADNPVTLGGLFTARCNETPLTLELVSEAVGRLRDDFKEVDVFSPEGKLRPRAVHLSPRDLVKVKAQRSFLRTLGKRS